MLWSDSEYDKDTWLYLVVMKILHGSLGQFTYLTKIWPCDDFIQLIHILMCDLTTDQLGIKEQENSIMET